MLKKYVPGRNAVDYVVTGSHIYGNLRRFTPASNLCQSLRITSSSSGVRVRRCPPPKPTSPVTIKKSTCSCSIRSSISLKCKGGTPSEGPRGWPHTTNEKGSRFSILFSTGSISIVFVAYTSVVISIEKASTQRLNNANEKLFARNLPRYREFKQR